MQDLSGGSGDDASGDDASGDDASGDDASGNNDYGSGSQPSVDCDFNLTESSGNFSSPGYTGYTYDTYKNNLTCQWRIEKPDNALIKLTFLNMGLESESTCRFDHVQVSTRFCIYNNQ